QVLPKLAAFGEAQQLVVGRGAPEEVGEARRQLEFTDRPRRRRVVRRWLKLAVEQKVWRDQYTLHRVLHAAVQVFALLARERVQLDQPIDLVVRQRASPGA